MTIMAIAAREIMVDAVMSIIVIQIHFYCYCVFFYCVIMMMRVMILIMIMKSMSNNYVIGTSYCGLCYCYDYNNLSGGYY